MKSIPIIRNALLSLLLIPWGTCLSAVATPRGQAPEVETPGTTAPVATSSDQIERPSSLTIEECYAKARTNYPLVSRYGLIQQSEEYSLANANRGYLPQFSLSARATYQTDVTKIPSAIASISDVGISALSKDQYQAIIELDQVIWDGGMIRSQKRNIKASTEVDRQQQEVDMYAIRDRINSLFFGTLLTEEQLRLNTLYDEELARNYEKVQSYVANGTANAADLDAVRVEQLSNRQKRAELETTRSAYRLMLGAFTRADLTDTELVQPIAELEPIREISRPELRLYEAQESQLDAQAKSVTARNLPQLSFYIQGAYGKPGLNMLQNGFRPYAIGGIRLSWYFGNFYTKRNDLRQIDVSRDNISVQRETFLFNTRQQISSENGEVEMYRRTLADDDEIITLRDNIMHASEAKVEHGTMSVSDYMDDVTAAETARQDQALHRMQLLMSLYNLKNLTGD